MAYQCHLFTIVPCLSASQQLSISGVPMTTTAASHRRTQVSLLALLQSTTPSVDYYSELSSLSIRHNFPSKLQIPTSRSQDYEHKGQTSREEHQTKVPQVKVSSVRSIQLLVAWISSRTPRTRYCPRNHRISQGVFNVESNNSRNYWSVNSPSTVFSHRSIHRHSN